MGSLTRASPAPTSLRESTRDLARAVCTVCVGVRRGFQMADTVLAGARPAPDVRKAVVLITDGRHNQPGDPVAEAAALRAQGYDVYVIGPCHALVTTLSVDESGPSRGVRLCPADRGSVGGSGGSE